MKAEDTKVADWLCWFDDRDCKPFALADGRRCATDGAMAVITDDGGPVAGLPQLKRDRVDLVLALLALPSIHSATLTAEQFSGMIGPHAGITTGTCDECNGAKRQTHLCGCHLCEVDTEPCVACDGTGRGEQYPEQRAARFWGQPFDMNRVTYIVAHAPAASEYTIRLVREKDLMHQLQIVTVGWVAILSGLYDDAAKHRPEMIAMEEPTCR